MISAKSIDTNRSRDVEGPELIRPKDEDLKMSDNYMGDHTGMLSKHPLSSLTEGHIEKPLQALGAQEVVVKHPMGEASAKQSGVRQSLPKGLGRSVAGKLEEKAKKY